MYIEWFQAKTGVQFNHIPYKGPAQLQQAMAAGEVDIANMSPASIAPYTKSGKVRFVGVATGPKRSSYIVGIPTFSEQGFDIDFRNWLALVGPKGLSMDLARRWNAEANKLLSDKAWVDKVMTPQALTPTGGSPEDLVAIIEAKRKLGAELARIAKLKYD
jgi:tripartite-type tricarboxylate transporter receptor subunit TctC